jgi:hypothetical protein
MRRILVFLATMVMGVVLASGVALAAAVSEVEPNDSIATAQDIDASFDLSANPDIIESTTVLHATVNGTGNDTQDYYKFTVPAGDPARVVLDMDHTTPDDTTGTDPQYAPLIELYDSSGTRIDFSVDDGGDPGSTFDGDDPNGRDPRIVMDGADKLAAGTYYVGVGSFVDGTWPPIMGTVLAGATYQLHVSIGGDDPPGTDATSPTVLSIDRDDASPTNASSVSWTVKFSESVTFPDFDDFALDASSGLTGASFTTISIHPSGSGDVYAVAANTGTGEGTLGLNLVDDDSIVDGATNKLGGLGTGNGDFSGPIYTVDKKSPTVSSTTPPDGATKVSRTNPNITATFSEALAPIPTSTWVMLQKVKGQGQRETFLANVSTTVVQSSPTVVTITPAVTLDKGSYYRVRILGTGFGATDLLGNPLQQTFSWRFKTAPK